MQEDPSTPRQLLQKLPRVVALLLARMILLRVAALNRKVTMNLPATDVHQELPAPNHPLDNFLAASWRC